MVRWKKKKKTPVVPATPPDPAAAPATCSFETIILELEKNRLFPKRSSKKTQAAPQKTPSSTAKKPKQLKIPSRQQKPEPQAAQQKTQGKPPHRALETNRAAFREVPFVGKMGGERSPEPLRRTRAALMVSECPDGCRCPVCAGGYFRKIDKAWWQGVQEDVTEDCRTRFRQRVDVVENCTV